MQLLWPSVTTLAVTAIHCAWRAYTEVHEKRKRQLRKRITYMLWVMANQGE